MQILIVTDAWYPQVNGVVRTLSMVAGELRKRGHRVAFITPQDRPSVPLPFYKEISLTLMTTEAMIAEIRANAPDVIQIATEGPLGWIARRACRKLGYAFTTGFHTRFAEYAAARIPLPDVLELGWSILRRFHAPSQAVMAPTPSIARELAARGFGNVKVWTRGVDHDLFKVYDGDHFDLPRPRLLYAGRLAVEKGIADFLTLRTGGSKIVVGDGPQRELLASQFPEVIFTGFRHGENYARSLASADVLVFPSRTDTFGLVMLEAMACGTPVAAFDVPSPVDVVEQEVSGFLSSDLATAVAGALQLDRQKVRRASLRYSWAQTAELFESWLVPVQP